jgi:hypothetical protein
MLIMKKSYVPTTLAEFINESKTMTLKRGYGERKPVVVGSTAPLRNQVLLFVNESKRVSRNELRKFISGLNENNSPAATTMWLKRNSQYFITESKNGITYYKLSTIGQRLANRFTSVENTTVSEGFRERLAAKRAEKEECEECEEDEKADFYDRKKGYPRPGINDVTESDDSDVKEEYESKKERVERILENLRKKRGNALLEEEEEKPEEEAEETEEVEGEEKKGDDEDEFDLGDLDLDTSDEGEEESGEEVEGDEEKVEITEFILTVDNPDEAIAELEELGITAEKVVPEKDEELEDEELEGEGNDEIGLEEPEEGGEGEELEGGEGEGEGEELSLEEAAEDEPVEDEVAEEPVEDIEDEVADEEPVDDVEADKEVGDENEGQIKVSAENWEALKGWLEEKGVDVVEMFGGEIETEEGEEETEEEGEEEETEEGEEEAMDLNDEGEEEAGEDEDLKIE